MAKRVIDELIGKLGYEYEPKALEKFKNDLSGAGLFLKRFGLALIAGATGAIAVSVKMAITGDEIAKFARQAGVTTDALQELRFASDRQGVSSSELDTSLIYLNRNLGDLRRGMGTMKTAFEKSNPELAAMLALSNDTEDAFSLLMQAIHDAPDDIAKTDIAVKAFGRSGSKMVRIAEAGEQGLIDLRREAHALGGVMDKELLKISEETLDRLTDLKTIWRGIASQIALTILPIFTSLADKFKKWYIENKKIINQKVDKYFREVAAAIKILFDFIYKKLKILGKVVEAIGGIDVAMGLLIATFTGFEIGKIAASLLQLSGAFKSVGKAATGAKIASVGALGGIPALVAGAIGVLYLLDKNWARIRKSFEETAFFDAANRLKAFFSEIYKSEPIQRIENIGKRFRAAVGVREELMERGQVPMPASAATVTTNRNQINQNMTFNIKSEAPKEVAVEVERILKKTSESTTLNLATGTF